MPSPPSAPPAVDAGSNSPLKEPVALPIAATTEASSGFGRWLGVLGIAIVIVALIGYRLLARASAPPASSSAPTPSAPPAAPAPIPTPAPAPVESAAAAVEAPAPASSAASGSAPATSASAAKPAAATGESHRVTFKSSPPKARFFHFGKEIGTAPFTLEFKPAERHSYEVGLPGYITRKVTVDGSKPEITVGLRKESR